MQVISFEGLAATYAWPPAGPWVRAMMLHSLDGAVAGPDGRSGSISSPADRMVLSQVRALADAVVIGAGTMRAERYSPMRAKPEHAAERAALGLAAAPVLVTVSGRLDLPWEEAVFAESAIRPIVITGEASTMDARAAASSACDLVVLPGERVTPHAVLAELTRRGLHRVVCEGGPELLADWLSADVVDELDLTIAPWLAGHEIGGPSFTLPTPIAMSPLTMMVHEGFAFMRYARTGALAERP